MIAMVGNAALLPEDMPGLDADDDAMFAFAASFHGYAVWGGWDPCALAANKVAAEWEGAHQLPSSLTLLRTALFFESRRERFVDFGGFGDDPDGWAEHRAYMRKLLERIRRLVGQKEKDHEDGFVTSWLESHAPAPRLPADDQTPDDEGWLRLPAPEVDDDDVAAAVTLAARMLGVDLAAGEHVNESLLRERLCLALRHLSAATTEPERSVPVRGFQGVGPVDVVLRDTNSDAIVGLVECKWSVDINRDKIYEGAWDAVKLSLAEVATSGRWLVTGAPDQSWSDTETPDLFAEGAIDTVELWGRELRHPGPNGGTTVGADCQAGGRGNMFTDAAEQLQILSIVSAPVPKAGITLKASRVAGDGRMVHFASPPEFPAVIGQEWLVAHVATMPPDQFERLLERLRAKRWTEQDLAERVLPLRDAET
jgi:hypothetical protein